MRTKGRLAAIALSSLSIALATVGMLSCLACQSQSVNIPGQTITVTSNPSNSAIPSGTRLVYQIDLSKIDPSSRTSATDSDVSILRKRLDAMGIAQYSVYSQAPDRIIVDLSALDAVKAKPVIGLTAIIEFGEQTTRSDPAAKWIISDQTWKPALGTLNGSQVPLTSGYFQNNTQVNIDNSNQVVLQFQWNSDGAVLSGEITTRLLQKPLGIFSGDKLISSPTIQALITASGVIQGLTQDVANQLSKLLNAGIITAPLNLVDEISANPAN